MSAPTPIWKGPTDQLLEMPDSPAYDFGRTDIACARTYMGTYALAFSSVLPAGTIGTGAMTGWLVKRCQVSRQRGGVGKLVINYGPGGEGGNESGAALPPDEVGLTPFEVNPALERHPRYATLTDADWDQIDNAMKIYKKDGNRPVALTGLPLEFVKKKKRGIANYYLAGFRYSWTRSFYSLEGLANIGGFIQTPTGPFASFIPSTFSCLRQADDIKWTGSIWKYTISWICCPASHFDSDLYTA